MKCPIKIPATQQLFQRCAMNHFHPPASVGIFYLEKEERAHSCRLAVFCKMHLHLDRKYQFHHFAGKTVGESRPFDD